MGLGSRCAALAQLSRVAHVAADTPRCIAFAHVSGSPARCGHAVWRSVLHKLVALPLGPPLLLRPGRLAGYRAGDRTAAGTRRCWYYQQRPVDRIRPLARPQPAPHPRPGLSQAAPCLRPRCVARGVWVGHTALTPSVPVRSQLASAPPFVWVAAADGPRFRLTLARLG